VARYLFKPAQQDIPLTAETKEAFELTSGLFKGTEDPHKDTFVPKGSTGMFISITVEHSDGRREKINHIKASPSARLWPIYDFVKQSMRSIAPEMPLNPAITNGI